MKSYRPLFLLLLVALCAPLSAQDKPNILFIAIDDQNDWVGPLGGHPQVQTPHLDKLAARGTTFLNAHCQSPLCNPSRTSLMTGMRPSSTGVYSLQPWFREVEELKDIVTLPQYLKEHGGYTTYSTGKIYHGGYGRKPKDNEFDELGPGASGKPFPPQKLVNTPQDHKLVDWGTFPHKDEDKGDYIVASWAEETLDSKPEGPFFLSVGFFLPHVPLFATQKWFDLYPEETTLLPPILKGDREDTPRFSWLMHWKLPEPRLKFLEENNETLNITRSYLACVSFMDAQLGRVTEALERNGYADNTIVVVWSDHGWHLGEKEITGKNTLWDPGTRVPLIFAGPGIGEGETCNQPAELLDIYPTLVELTELPANAKNEGLSLMPQLKDASTVRERPAITHHGPDNQGIRTVDWRYIRYADGSEELYNMAKDPNEWENLADNPEYAAKKAELSKWLTKGDKRPVEGSRSRRIEIIDGKVFWELEEVKPTDPIPEI